MIIRCGHHFAPYGKSSVGSINQSFDVWISDSFGNEKQISFQFNSRLTGESFIGVGFIPGRKEIMENKEHRLKNQDKYD